MSEEIKNLNLCTDHRKSFSRFDFFTERPCDYCALLQENYELHLKLLVAAEAQSQLKLLLGFKGNNPVTARNTGEL